MIDVKEKQKELLEDHYKCIIEKINEHFKHNQSFILRDLLEEQGKNHNYYIMITKGILMALLDLEYVRVSGLYNGYKNFIYTPLKEIPLSFNEK